MSLRDRLTDVREWAGRTDRLAQLVVLVILAQLVVGPAAIAATNTYAASSGTTVETDSGLTVTVTDDRDLEAGNPFPDSDSVELKNVTVSSTSGGSVDLDTVPEDGGGRVVSVSDVSAGSDEVFVTHPDGTRLGVDGGNSVSELEFNDTVKIGDGKRDFNVSAGSSTVVLVDTGGTAAAAVDSGGNVIDDGSLRSDGVVRFDIPSGTNQVYLEASAAKLRVFNETSPSSLVSDGTGIRVRFFEEGNDNIIERNVTDGTVNLDTVPSDTDFTVTAAANESSYYYRRIPLQNLQEQQQIYLLPKSADASTVEFELTDRTGRFQNPILRVQKPIRKDFDGDNTNETKYQTIVGDSFGTSGTLTLNLEKNERYRLLLENENGETRVLGSFTPDLESQRVPLTVAQVNLAPEDGESGVATDAQLVEQANGDYVLRTLYQDPNQDTSEVTITVTNSSNTTVVGPTTFDSGPYGRLVNTYSVNGTPDNETYTVKYKVIRDGGSVTLIERVGNISPWNIGYLSGLVSSLTAWVALFGLAGLTVIRAPRVGAVATVVVATIFATLEFISIGPVPLGIAGATAILFVISRGTGQ